MEIQLCSICKQTEEKTGIDIGLLLEKLSSVKGKELSEYEKKYLCLSLASYTTAQIAYFMYKHELL
ncbi:hypothetical protein WKK05_22490 [Nostoc sp. UHCC 0302]|uniref:hypothetical protein n=1 Tax=Nostoc sp. UHCC 0302 TaxID=3134896 RepID=UPI00311CA1FE